MAAESEKKQVLEMIQADGADEGCVTFVLHDEDHTLGNSLRYMIMKNVEVDFCGYTITHPSESKINFRIQTRGGVAATEPLRRGLNELTDVCQHVLNTFQVRRNYFPTVNHNSSTSGVVAAVMSKKVDSDSMIFLTIKLLSVHGPEL
uniref:DNA-directed RNA polymerases I and III subunit RPAC2 n=1 Tax=Cynoglossus semilaevis TaxID=244447 RepID=A0A3P8WPX9_CYNSE